MTIFSRFRRRFRWHCGWPCKSSVMLPTIGIVLGLITGIGLSLHSTPFLMFRFCRGSCDIMVGEEDVIEGNGGDGGGSPKIVMILLIPSLLFHLPSSLCYLIIYCVVKKHQVRMMAMFIPTIPLWSCPNGIRTKTGNYPFNQPPTYCFLFLVLLS